MATVTKNTDSILRCDSCVVWYKFIDVSEKPAAAISW
jgi:hypothetical protein